MTELSSQDIKKVVDEYLKNKRFLYLTHNSIYKKFEKVAKDLNLVEKEGNRNLNNEDFLKMMDYLWEYFLKGYIAPGKSELNEWFPYAHLTEKGMKEFED